jgi:hypothetical protein
MEVPTCVFREFPFHAFGRMGQKYRPTYDPGMPAGTQPALHTSTGIDGAEASPPSRRPCRRLYRRGLPHRACLICAMNAAVLATPELATPELAGTIAAA